MKLEKAQLEAKNPFERITQVTSVKMSVVILNQAQVMVPLVQET